MAFVFELLNTPVKLSQILRFAMISVVHKPAVGYFCSTM